MNAITVKDVWKKYRIYHDKGSTLKEKILFKNRNRYEDRWVLKGINLEIKKGETIGLIGKNGSGKSTLLKLLTKIIYPSKGEIEINGKVSSLLELGAGFHPDMTGRENIYTNAAIFGLTKEEIDKKLNDIIDFSELEEFIDNPVRTYSSGMYMRLAFSVAINVDAEILLIDEILTVGDTNFQAKCFNKIIDLQNNGVTIIIVSHSFESLKLICNKIIAVEDGRVLLEGRTDETIDKYLTHIDYKIIDNNKPLEKNGKVLFINLPCHKYDVLTVYPPLGILSMSSCLKQKGYEVEFIDADVLRLEVDYIIQRIKEISPNLIGITLNAGHMLFAKRYIKRIKKQIGDIPIVVGGPYATGRSSQVFDDFPLIDYAIIGEGEYAIVDLMDFLAGKKQLHEVRNLIYIKDEEVKKNRCERIKDLDAIPLPDYHLVSSIFHKYTAPTPSIGNPSIAIMCSRGCPYNCTFCSSPYTWKRESIYRSVESVINEIIYLYETFNVKEIFLQDDTLNVRIDWFMELCDKIIENKLNEKIYFKCPFRVNTNILTEEILKKAKEANFWMIFYGVENGNEKMLKRMNKNITLDEIKHAFHLTKQNNIATYASFMIGNDGETVETVNDSIELLQEISPDYGGFAIATPFPGSELFNIANEKNLILKEFKDYEFGECILKTEELNQNDIIRLTQEANSIFNDIKAQNQKLTNDDLKNIKLSVDVSELNTFTSTYINIPVKVVNRSRKPFNLLDRYPLNISYHWLEKNNNVYLFEGERTSLEKMFIDEKVFDTKIITPYKPGEYILRILLVQENNRWFDKLGVNIHVQVI